MDEKLMDVDELISKDSEPATLSNQVEDVQLSVKWDLKRKFEVFEGSDLETEFPRLPQVVDQDRQDYHRNMNEGETFTHENCLFVNELNHNYFCNSAGIFESIRAVRFETAFMQNSLSRLSYEDDDFRIDSHPSHGSQTNFKYSGANISQIVITTNREAVDNLPVKYEGLINGITNEASSPNEVISETENIETNEVPVIQLVNSGVNDADHREENCKEEVPPLTASEIPSSMRQCERHAVERGFGAFLEATTNWPECELSSDIQIESQGKRQLTTKTAKKTVCDTAAAAKYFRFVTQNLGQDENVETVMVADDQSYLDPGEMFHIGCEINKNTEVWLTPLSMKKTGPLTECKNSTERKSPIDCKMTGESLIATDFESAIESAIDLQIAGENLNATDFESAIDSSIDLQIAGENLNATDFESAIESAIDLQIARENLNVTDSESAIESAIAYQIAGANLNATEFKSAIEISVYPEISRENLNATDFESAIESVIDLQIAVENLKATDFVSAVESFIDVKRADESIVATDFECAVEGVIGSEIAWDCLIATNCESAVESKSAIEGSSATESNSCCKSEGDALNNLEFVQRQRCDIKVSSDTCSDLIEDQYLYESEIIVEFCDQAEVKLKHIGNDETMTKSKLDTGNDFQIEKKAENMTVVRDEIRHKINEDFENNSIITAKSAVEDEVTGSNNSKFCYNVENAYEAEQNNIQDNWKATIFAIPLPVLIENAELPRHQIKQDINLKIKDEANEGGTDEKTDGENNTGNAVMDDIVTDEDQHVIQAEHHPISDLDGKFYGEFVEENREKSFIADADIVVIYSSEYVNLNDNKVNDRNEHGSKAKTEIDGSNCDEDKITEELSKEIKTEHKSHPQTEACRVLEVEMRSKIVIQDQVEDILKMAQLPVRGHQEGIGKIPLQHGVKNVMGERSSIEHECKTGDSFENYGSMKIICGNIHKIAKDVIDRKYGALGEESASKSDKSKQKDDVAICQFEDGLSVQNQCVVEDINIVSNYLEPECKKNDGCFTQLATVEMQNETVAIGEILCEVDTVECVDVQGLTDVSSSEGLLKNHLASNIGLAETGFNFTPCSGQSQSSIHNDRSGFVISMDGDCSEIGASFTFSAKHNHKLCQSQDVDSEKHLECSYQFIHTGKTKMLDTFHEINLIQHDVKGICGSQQHNSTEVQDHCQNPRSAQKEVSNLDLVLSSTIEKSNSFNFQAQIISCDVPTDDVDFEEPTSVCDQFEIFNDENEAFSHCDDEITTFSYLDYGLGSKAEDLTTKCDRSVPDLEASEGDSNGCNTFGNIPNQANSFTVTKVSDKSQQHSSTIIANESISYSTANLEEEESSCFVQSIFSSENIVLSPADNSLLLYSSTVHCRHDDTAKPDVALWSDATLLKTESCFAKAYQTPAITFDEPFNCEQLLPVRNQQQPDRYKHLQHGLHEVENLDVCAVPPMPTDSCTVNEGSSLRKFNAFGKVSDVSVAEMSITQSDFAERCMTRDLLMNEPQEVPSCQFTEDNLQMSTETTSTMCISAEYISGVDLSPAKEISPCSEFAFDISSDEQQVPSVESMKHGHQMRDVSYLPNHLEETLYEEPPAKRRCCDVGVGGNFDHNIDHKWCKDKHETVLGGCRLTSLTGDGKERVPLYTWKNLAESNFEDHSEMTEQSYSINRDTAAAVPLVMPQLSRCQKPLRLGLSRRYRAPTRLHPNYRTPTD